MRIETQEQDFIKTHQGMLKRIIKNRMDDYFNKVVDEPDLQRKEVLSLMVKEFRMALTMIDNFSIIKKDKPQVEEFTGL